MHPIEQLAVVNYRKRFGPSAAGLKICYDLLLPLQKKKSRCPFPGTPTMQVSKETLSIIHED